MMMPLLQRLTDGATARRGALATVALWLLAAAVLPRLAPALASVYDNAATVSIPGAADSQVGQRLLRAGFPASRGTAAVLVFHDPAGMSRADRARIRRLAAWLTAPRRSAVVGAVLSIFTAPGAADQLTSRDGTTMTMIVTLQVEAADAALPPAVAAIRRHLVGVTAGTPLQAHLTGPAGVIADEGAIFISADVTLLLATVTLVLVLLLVLYRSPLLALLPLLAVGLALQVVDAALGVAGHAGLFAVGRQATAIMTVLLFGAGTDYTIFIVARYREELQRTEEARAALRVTMQAVGEAIASSAGTVVLALLTLGGAALGLYNSLGPPLAIAVAVMLLAGLTLVPAVLALWAAAPTGRSSRATNGRRRPRTSRDSAGCGARWAGGWPDTAASPWVAASCS